MKVVAGTMPCLRRFLPLFCRHHRHCLTICFSGFHRGFFLFFQAEKVAETGHFLIGDFLLFQRKQHDNRSVRIVGRSKQKYRLTPAMRKFEGHTTAHTSTSRTKAKTKGRSNQYFCSFPPAHRSSPSQHPVLWLYWVNILYYSVVGISFEAYSPCRLFFILSPSTSKNRSASFMAASSVERPRRYFTSITCKPCAKSIFP